MAAEPADPIHRIVLVDAPDTPRDAVVERTATLARVRGAPVTVLAIVPSSQGLFRGAPVDVSSMLVGDCADRAASTAALLRARGAVAEPRVRVGVPVVEVVREVLATGAELVVKLESGGARHRARFGSLDFQLLRKCPCPLLLCRTRDRVPYRKVAAAVDPCDVRQDRDAGLDDAILGWAAALAAVDGAELLALHAFDFPIETFLRIGRGAIPPADLEQHRDATRRASQASLDALLARHDAKGLTRRATLLDGPAAEAIPEAAEREAVDLLVLGTVARSGIAGLLIGNTAEEIVRDVDCAVLAVKPAGFVSPIRPE